jgi:hypothetical protein
MSFSIHFLPQGSPQNHVDSGGRTGIIHLGDYEEVFVADTSFWTVADYEHQWKSGLDRAVNQGLASCLITSMHDPMDAEMLFWWLLFPAGERIFLQEAILRFNQLHRSFNPNDLYSYIPERRTHNNEGRRISEWEVSRNEIVEFLVSIDRQTSM